MDPRFEHSKGERGDSRARSAFTLIELLVVISIISLLVSILLPALANARQNAEHLKCAVNIRSGSLAFMRYFNDFSDYMPPLHDGTGSWGYNYGSWYSRIRPYVTRVREQNGNLLHEQARELMCPSRMSGTYAYGRPHLPYSTIWFMRFRTWGDGSSSWRVDELKAPSDTGLLLDGSVYYDTLRLLELWRSVNGYYQYESGHLTSVKHNGRGLGISYMDGHAEFVRVKSKHLGLNYNQVPDEYPFTNSRFWGYRGSNQWVSSWATSYTSYDP